jgi:hypothetical protein
MAGVQRWKNGISVADDGKLPGPDRRTVNLPEQRLRDERRS